MSSKLATKSNNKTYPGLLTGHVIDVLKVLKTCHHEQQQDLPGLLIGHVTDVLKTSHHEQQDLPSTLHRTCHKRLQSPQNLPP